MSDFFKEIGTSHRWEQFACTFLQAFGYNIISTPSYGQDGGVDLIVEEPLVGIFNKKAIRYIVSCKYQNKKIGTYDEKGSIQDRVGKNAGCTGFIGFYSEDITSTFDRDLEGLKANKKIEDFKIFRDIDIETFLITDKKGIDVLRVFLPTKYEEIATKIKKEVEENTNFKWLVKDDLKTVDRNYFERFYTGEPPKWSIIKKYAFNRDAFSVVIDQLERNKVSLITGAGGEGKTTLLMQVGLHYFEKKYKVGYCFDGVQNFDLNNLQFDKKDKYLLIIDQVNYIHNLKSFIEKIKLCQNVKVLFAARKNEWLQYLHNSRDYKDLNILISNEEITLSTLSTTELNELENLLKKYNSLHESSKENFKEIIKAESNRSFLLATMLLATKGKKFEFYISDVINNIRSWQYGNKTLKAIGYIVCVEVIGKRLHGIVYCSEKLLKRLMDVEENFFYLIKNNLAQEAFFQQNAEKFIHTRNPLIAKIYFDKLFNDSLSFFSKEEFYSDIIRECATLNTTTSSDIIASIPLYLRNNGFSEISKELLKRSIDCGFFFQQYAVFIDDEIKSHNIGDYYSNAYSARWLCLKSWERNSRSVVLSTKWAQLEIQENNIGDQEFTQQYSARWILKKGFDSSYDSNLAVVWAQLEIQENNIGDQEFIDEYAARWILKTAFDKTSDSNLAIVWAQLEIREKNIGDQEFTQQYSARWILKNAFNKNADPQIALIWAQLEMQQNNIGDKDFIEKYSARWIFKNAFDKNADPQIAIVWAQLEMQQNNIGDRDFIEKYSARWIFKNAFDKNADPQIAIVWAQLEMQQNNIGDRDFIEKYSARWILKNAFDKNADPQIAIVWAQLEMQQNNIGDRDFIEKYSARWILKNAFDKNADAQIAVVWAQLEMQQNNIGDRDFIEKYSARWILKNAFDIKSAQILLVVWTKIEMVVENYGDDLKMYSALWLLARIEKAKKMTTYEYVLWSIIEFYKDVNDEKTTSLKQFRKAIEKSKNQELHFNNLIFKSFDDWRKYLQNFSIKEIITFKNDELSITPKLF